MKVLLIDNFDSFTYNIAHYLEQLEGVDLCVKRYDHWVNHMQGDFDRIVISPGPGHASEYPGLMHTLLNYGKNIPVLGICLGMQCLGLAYGAELVNLGTVWHGRVKETCVTKKHFLWNGLPDCFPSGHYHSWVITKENFPQDLEILATESITGAIMAVGHRKHPVFGVQFHPESVMTRDGFQIIANFIRYQ